jgi:hypothetical protein
VGIAARLRRGPLERKSSETLSSLCAEYAEAFDSVDRSKEGILSVLDVSSPAPAQPARRGPHRLSAQAYKSLELVFRGPLPSHEASKVQAALAALNTPSVGRDAFLAAVHALRCSEGGALDNSHTAHYTSQDALRVDRRRGRTPSLGPEQMFTGALTNLQDYGWKSKEGDYSAERHVSKQCAETKFAGELWKAGLY